MFPMTVTIKNPDQLNAVMALLGGGEEPRAAAATVRTPRNTKADTKPEANEKVDTKKTDAAPSSEPAQTASDSSKDSSKESTQANESETEQPTYQEVAAAITKVSRTVGRDDAVALLDSFGAKRGPDLTPDQFVAVLDACEKALA